MLQSRQYIRAEEEKKRLGLSTGSSEEGAEEEEGWGFCSFINSIFWYINSIVYALSFTGAYMGLNSLYEITRFEEDQSWLWVARSHVTKDYGAYKMCYFGFQGFSIIESYSYDDDPKSLPETNLYTRATFPQCHGLSSNMTVFERTYLFLVLLSIFALLRKYWEFKKAFTKSLFEQKEEEKEEEKKSKKTTTAFADCMISSLFFFAWVIILSSFSPCYNEINEMFTNHVLDFCGTPDDDDYNSDGPVVFKVFNIWILALVPLLLTGIYMITSAFDSKIKWKVGGKDATLVEFIKTAFG